MYKYVLIKAEECSNLGLNHLNISTEKSILAMNWILTISLMGHHSTHELLCALKIAEAIYQ